MHAFDLRTNPWLPVKSLDGTVQELSLVELLDNAHQLQRVEGESPIVTVSLVRFLTGLTHHMMGEVKAPSELAEILRGGKLSEEKTREYFDDSHYGLRFDLYSDDWPFWQCPGLVNLDPKTNADRPVDVATLLHEVASGHTKTLFSHHFDSDQLSLTSAEAARVLITSQYFALGGLNRKTSSRFGHQQSYFHAPFVSGIPILVGGRSLFETILLNLVVKTQRPSELVGLDLGDPPWAENPDSTDLARRDATKGQTIPSTYLGFFLPRSRHIRLIPESDERGTTCVRRAHVAQGVAWDGNWEPWFPLATDSKKGTTWPLQLRVDRAVWRDSAAFLGFSGQDSPRSYTASRNLTQYNAVRLAFEAPGQAPLPPTARVESLTIVNDKRKPAKPLAWRDDVLDFAARAVEDRRLIQAIAYDLSMSERIARILSGSIKFFFDGGDLPVVARQRAAELNGVTLSALRSYWAGLDLPFRRRLTKETVDTDFVSQAIKIARICFNRTMDSVVDGDVRRFPERARASARFNGALTKVDAEQQLLSTV